MKKIRSKKLNFNNIVIFFITIFIFLNFSNGYNTKLYSQPVKSKSEKEIRGVWIHPGFFGTEKSAATLKIQSTLDEYQKAGINTLIILVKNTSGHVYYDSEIGIKDPAWNWDFFAVFLEEANKRKMIVHPWFCVFTESAILGKIREHPEWLIRSKKNEIVTIANPALPDVRQYEISLMIELINKYPVDWIHLDYIRFPCEPTEVFFSFDPVTRAQFKEYSGIDPLTIKAMDSGNMLWNEWIKWNSEQVTIFVRELKETLKNSKRKISISAAVFPDPDNAKVLIGQDWARWAEEGLVEMLCPMFYTNNQGFFEKYTKRAAEIAKGHCQMCTGIGIGTSHNQNTPDGMIKQLKTSEAQGANGVIFFSSSSLTKEFLEKLALIK
jgi:uncharacterized lipoprotein YddW (UPF0748 family)